ncbi:hypothetical protein [Bradymonas sediminis]|uniref:DUF4382 domain-containing protein n=1 Tax=Bradymonas sediminis TaxID=1548548 RepID=A0A2Z4FKG0_9DELT|nr:hypothetical protein [Bradymonas sediminis]AWV89174.1 hypothetical protein DN745_07410 [Bradymonas sediminis]
MMTKSKTYLALLIAGLLIFGVTACSDDSDSSNDSDSGVEQDATDAPDGEGTGELDPLPESWSFESEYSLRFTKFALDDTAPLHNLNTLLDKNIKNQDDKYPIVVLLNLRNIDEGAGSLDLRGGAGLKADLECLPSLGDNCDYTWDPDDSGEYTIGSEFDGTTGEMKAGLAALDFIVTFESGEDVLKSAIPISDLTLTGALRPTADESGVEIQNGVLVGYITEEAAAVAEIQLSAGATPLLLSELLKSTPKTDDLDGDGTNDAWLLTGTFIAVEASIVE